MQPSRIHHVGLPVSDLDRTVAWYREALGLTHESTAGVPEGVAFMVAPTGVCECGTTATRAARDTLSPFSRSQRVARMGSRSQGGG